MLKHGSASVREETPHGTEHTTYVTEEPLHSTRTTRTATIVNALTRRAQAILNDKSVDAPSRAIRYSLEINDPWLADLVRRAEAGETIDDTIDFSERPPISEYESSNQKLEALTEMICRAGDEPVIKSSALLVLMATLENSPHPKVLANATKHFVFDHCGELNLCGMVDAELSTLEDQLFAKISFAT